LIASPVVGSIGVGLALHARKQTRLPQLVTGVALMRPPVPRSAVWMLGLAGVLVGGLALAVRAGL
jgi:hypothetical protein